MNSTALVLPSGISHIGEVVIVRTKHGFELSHRDDLQAVGLEKVSVDQVRDISVLNDRGAYRPLKTAPNLRHGWKITVSDMSEVADAIDAIYPGRVAAFRASKSTRLRTTPLRDTLDRQSGIYRVAARITDAQLDSTVASFCRSNGGCLRTILWKQNSGGAPPSSKLPAEKYDPAIDQFAYAKGQPFGSGSVIPLLCQEACNLLVNECRKMVRGESLRGLADART